MSDPAANFVNSGIPGNNQLSIYGQNDGADDFPVLRAFQQYIDQEQSKSRKRMIVLCVFFAALMTIVVAVFVVLLTTMSQRNQQLNDRLVEYAMSQRDRMPVQPTTTIVQPAPAPAVQPDNSAITALGNQISALQKQIEENNRKTILAQENTSKTDKKLAEKASAEQNKTELEIIRLKTLLETEKLKNAEAQAKQKEAELELYRRQHYPELYKAHSSPSVPAPAPRTETKKKVNFSQQDVDDILNDLDDDQAIDYWGESDKDEKKAKPNEPYRIPVIIKGKKTSFDMPKES